MVKFVDIVILDAVLERVSSGTIRTENLLYRDSQPLLRITL